MMRAKAHARNTGHRGGTNWPLLAWLWQPAAHFPLPVLGRCRGRSRRKVGYARVFARKYWGTQPMFRRSEFSPVVSASLRQIDGRLRELERNLERVCSRTSSQAALAVEGIGDAVASTFSTMADRLRGGATSVGSEAAKFGNDA